MADFDQARNKRGIIIAAVVAVVAIIIGNLLPPIAVFVMKLLPNGAQTDLHLVSEDSLVLNLWALDDCAELPEPSCTHLQGPAELDYTITTTATEKFLETDVDSLMHIRVRGMPDTPYAEVYNHHRLNRDSAFPVTEPVATTTFRVPPLDEEIKTPRYTLEGLQFYFPFETERRSYQYTDPIVQTIVPLDYVDPAEVNGIRTYEFHADVPVSPLLDVLEDGPGLDGLADVTQGVAEQFFNPEEMAHFGYAEGQNLTLQPFYDAERTFFIEPKTGTVLDQKVAVNVFLAENNVQAREMVENDFNNPVRTVFSADFEFDDATIQAQTDVASPQMARIRALQVVSWLANVTTVASLAVIAWLLLRRRKHNALQSTDHTEVI